MKDLFLYAVKCLRNSVIEQEDTFIAGTVDLALEVSILAKLDHPNIIRLHGSSRGCVFESFRDEQGYFLVLDLLERIRWIGASSIGGVKIRIHLPFSCDVQGKNIAETS